MSSTTAVRLKMSFNFASQLIRASGWSETLDLGYADIPTAQGNLANISALLLDRAMCLGVGPLLMEATIYGLVQPATPGAPLPRRSSAAIPVPPFPAANQAYNKAFSNPGTTVLGVPFNYDADYSSTTLYINLQTPLTGTPVYHRNVWIAGLPDVADSTLSGVITEPNTQQAVTNYLNDLSNTGVRNGAKNSVCIRSVDRTNANPVKQCTAWNLAANTYTVPAHGFAQNQPVTAQGMKTIAGGSAPRGAYLVNVIDVNTISLQGAAVPTAPVKLGGFRARVFTFNNVGLAIAEGMTKRDKGRPSFLAVGRRRKPSISRV